jgi:hypothetical protein
MNRREQLPEGIGHEIKAAQAEVDQNAARAREMLLRLYAVEKETREALDRELEKPSDARDGKMLDALQAKLRKVEGMVSDVEQVYLGTQESSDTLEALRVRTDTGSTEGEE